MKYGPSKFVGAFLSVLGLSLFFLPPPTVQAVSFQHEMTSYNQTFVDRNNGDLNWLFTHDDESNQIVIGTSQTGDLTNMEDWIHRGSLPISGNFKVNYQIDNAGKAYTLLAYECHDYDICLMVGTINNTDISWSNEKVVLDGNSPSKAYYSPSLTVNQNDQKIYVAASYEDGQPYEKTNPPGNPNFQQIVVVSSNQTFPKIPSSFSSPTAIGPKTLYLGEIFITSLKNTLTVIANGDKGTIHAFQMDQNSGNWNEVDDGNYDWVGLNGGNFGMEENDTTGTVNAMIIYNDKLYIGGRFNLLNGVEANSIISFDGQNWTALGPGIQEKDEPVSLFLKSSTSENNLPPGIVKAFSVYENKLIVGGDFNVAGGQTAYNLATWDGQNWSNIGSSLEDFRYNDINVMTVYQDQLIIGGNFSLVGGVTANNIVAWDGQGWLPLAEGLKREDGYYFNYAKVRALAIYQDKLIVGGEFDWAGEEAVGSLAAWDGQSWSTFGSGVSTGEGSGYIFALLADNNQLYVGGSFDTINDIPAHSLAVFDGSQWSSFGTGVQYYFDEEYSAPGEVVALSIFQGKLVVGGGFNRVNGTTVSGIAYLDGSSWKSVGAGVEVSSGLPGYIMSMQLYQNYLFIAGQYDFVDGQNYSLPVSIDSSFNWALDNNKFGNDLISYSRVDWESGYVLNLAEINDLTIWQGKLVVAGNFTIAGGKLANSIALWDGQSWTTLDKGLINSGEGVEPAEILAVAVYQDKLIVGGNFNRAGSMTIYNIASWDGNNWHSLDGGVNGSVHALEVFQDQLIVGGDFNYAGQPETEIEVNSVASWNGNHWSALGGGLIDDYYENYYSGDVYDFEVFNDQLIAAGRFSLSNETNLCNLARWNGSSWEDLGQNLLNNDCRYSYLYSLKNFNNQLVVGGNFWISNDSDELATEPLYKNIAIFDGQNWHPLGDGINYPVTALEDYQGRIIAGSFEQEDNLWASNYNLTSYYDNLIMAWDGNQWSTLGSGLRENFYTFYEKKVSSLLVHNNRLYAGGSFAGPNTYPEVFNPVASYGPVFVAPTTTDSNFTTYYDATQDTQYIAWTADDQINYQIYDPSNNSFSHPQSLPSNADNEQLNFYKKDNELWLKADGENGNITHDFQIYAGPVTVEDNLTLNLDINPYLGLDCEDAVNLGAIPVYGNAYGNFKCSVISNSLFGYDISITQANNLVNGAGAIQPLGAEGSLNQLGSGAKYALNASTTAMGDALTWKTEGTLHEVPRPSLDPTGDDFEGRVGVSVGQNSGLPPGNYSGTFTLTATAL